MHNGGTIPIVLDKSAKPGFQGHASDFSLLNKIMIIMAGSPYPSVVFYLARAILSIQDKKRPG